MKWIFLCSLLLITSVRGRELQQAGDGRTVARQRFDTHCGEQGHNCRSAFQHAFYSLNQSGGGTLLLPAGDFLIDFPDIAQNVLAGPPIQPTALLVVPPNVGIVGHLDASGAPDTVIEWKRTSIPTFIFVKSSNASMRNLHIRFSGTTPASYPYGDIAMLRALGYQPTFPHQNQMAGGNFELFCFAYAFESDRLTFDHLIFDSAQRDNQHVYGGAINLKGKGVIENNGAGLTDLAQSNRITNIELYDFVMGFSTSGQNDLEIRNIKADWRGSTANTAPGHVLYTTNTNEFDASGKLARVHLSTNVTVDGIVEGKNTLSNAVALGTLAIKDLDGARISNISSQHPEGLLQTVMADQNVTFSHMKWWSDFALCEDVPKNCGTPVINSTGSPSGVPQNKNITYEDISLRSTRWPITVTLMGDDVKVNGLHIETPPDLLPGQSTPVSVLNLRYTQHSIIRDYVYTPLLTNFDPEKRYNSAFTGWNTAKNVDAEVTVRWPKDVPLPPGHRAAASGFQSKDPADHNAVHINVVPKE